LHFPEGEGGILLELLVEKHQRLSRLSSNYTLLERKGMERSEEGKKRKVVRDTQVGDSP
jgi:hypothetical protein